jgi:hypothetical protein
VRQDVPCAGDAVLQGDDAVGEDIHRTALTAVDEPAPISRGHSKTAKAMTAGDDDCDALWRSKLVREGGREDGAGRRRTWLRTAAGSTGTRLE